VDRHVAVDPVKGQQDSAQKIKQNEGCH
jgi:hypothetical protein